MKLEDSHIAQIKHSFDSMQSKDDLLNLLNEAKPFVYGPNYVPFKLKQLTWYANPKLGRSRYHKFNISKKNGTSRAINAPVNGLKSIQKTLSFILQCVFEPHKAAMGFVKDKSIVDNARTHEGSRYVYNIDLKDFFSSIDQARVWKCLQLRPFNLSSPIVSEPKMVSWDEYALLKGLNNQELTIIDDELKIADASSERFDWVVTMKPNRGRLVIANIIASICCTEMEVERKNKTGEWEKVKRNVLPQGAPTSPVITNIVCQRLDYLLSGVANRFGLKYSRYADDITFSSMHNVYQPESEFLRELHRIIAEQNFHIKESKTRLRKDGYRKEVTGLLVNEKVNVQQRYIKQLRMWLYYWERFGYERALGFFLQQYFADKGHIKHGKPNMANVISGKLDYLKMVKGADNELYQKLKCRFELLTGKDTLEVISNAANKDKTKPELHNPKTLVALLKNFSVNNSALKYTTHSWDAGRDANMFKDLSEFLSIAKSQYSEFSFALEGLSENLNGKIYNFLFNKEIATSGWGDINPKKRIYFGWSSPELLEACKNDVSLNPEDFILPEKFQIQRSGKTLQKFKHIIDVFKNEIEVRDENSALLNLILQKHDNYLIDFSPPKVANLENKTFYTDIQWFSKALDLIFKGIKDRPKHQDVEYFVTENNSEKLILNILHKNSFKQGVSINNEKLNLTRGDFGYIKTYLMNLCDWSIESEFAEGAYRINYLVSDNKIPAHVKVPSAEGFKHILTFYK